MEEIIKPRVLSGIQPTGGFTLGNYIGAISNWRRMQDDNDCIYFIADLHSLTVRREAAEVRRSVREAAAMTLACGVDPEKSILFIQSDVPAHCELSWILSCYTQFGELGRMTQFKDKSAKHPENVNAGLFTYPVLMAADILIYNTDLVPVGADQQQHIEIARDIANRFNSIYGDILKVPEGFIPKSGGRVMSLQDPTSKMSKSDENVNAKIMLTDESDAIIKKFKRAVTDSDNSVHASEDKPGILNLMTIYSALSGKSFDDIEKEFEGHGYGDFKTAVGECVASELEPIRNEYKRILADKAYLDGILKDGAEKASYIANRTLHKVRRKVGLE